MKNLEKITRESKENTLSLPKGRQRRRRRLGSRGIWFWMMNLAEVGHLGSLRI